MRTLGIIPARGQSKGLPNKHLLPLGGKTLIRRAVESAKAAKSLTAFLVSTDSHEIAAEAWAAGVEGVDHRPAHLATDEAGMIPVLQHVVSGFGNLGYPYDLIVLLQPTSPFRTGEDIDECVGLVQESGADSAQTVVAASYAPSKMMLLDDDGSVAFMNGHEAQRDTRRQDYDAWQPSGSVYVVRQHVLMKQGRLIGATHRALPRSWERSLNINTPWDWRIAEMVLARDFRP